MSRLAFLGLPIILLERPLGKPPLNPWPLIIEYLCISAAGLPNGVVWCSVCAQLRHSYVMQSVYLQGIAFSL